MAGIVSVERFSITLAAGTASNSATLTKSQTIANCVPFITKRITTIASPVDNWSQQCVDAYFSGSTVVVATSDGSTRALVVEVAVVEFDASKVTVQQGTYQITTAATSGTATISAVTLANSFVQHSWLVGSAPATNDPAAVRARFTSTTQLTFDRGASGGQVDGHYYVVESDTGDFSVQESTITLSAVSSNTGTITSVTTNKTFLVGSFTCASTADDNTLGSVDVTLTDATTITVQRNGSTGTIVWTGYAISFAAGGAETIQRGTITAQGATASQNVSITTVDSNLAMVQNAGNVSAFKSGSFPGAGSSDNSDAQCAWDFVDTSTIRVQHNTSGGEANNDISWEVIEWEISLSELEQEGYRWYNDGTESGSTARQTQDTVDTVDKGVTVQLRVLINATDDPDTSQFRLDYREESDPDAEYRAVVVP